MMLLGEVFDRMAKPVKLRSIVGLMGLEGSAGGGGAGIGSSDVGGGSSSISAGNEKLNKAIWDILSKASAEDTNGDGAMMEDAAVSGATNDVTGQPDVEDEWVRVLASLVQSAMFYKDEPTPQAEEVRCTKHLEDVAEGILRKVCERVAVSVEAEASSEGGETNTTRANLDPMHFVPQSLALLPPSEVKVCIPESASNADFTVNIDAPILKVDADVEQSRADEETKELENRERTHRMAQQQQKLQGVGTGGASAGGRWRGVGGRAGASGRGIPGRSALGAGRGGRGLGRQSAAGPDTASLFIRSKKPTASTATLGRGTARALLGRGRGRGAAGPDGGRGAASAGRGRGMGRGSAAAAVGKSLGVPTKKPMAMGNTSKRPGGKAAAAISGSGGAVAPGVGAVGGAAVSSALKGRAGRAMKASAGGMGGRSKMMMIDSAEVEKLNKEKQAAAAEEIAQTSGKSRKRKIMEAAAAEEAAKRSKSITGTAVPSAPAEPSPQQASAAVESPAATAVPVANIPSVISKPAASAPGGAAVPDGLLSKSNKLSSADRSRIERFFSDRFNPTPDQTTYKMKLNEERNTDAETGQSIKETLYLELDYTTFGYKKTRKIKKK